MITCYSGHPALRTDHARLARESRYIGLQADGDGGLLELYVHQPCGSTVARVATDLTGREPELRVLAAKYASHCRAGDTLFDGDRYFWPFAVHLPAALAARGLSLEHVPGGWRVRLTLSTPAPKGL